MATTIKTIKIKLQREIKKDRSKVFKKKKKKRENKVILTMANGTRLMRLDVPIIVKQ